MLHAPVAIVGEVFGEVADDLEQPLELLRGAALEVVGGEQVERGHLDAEVVAPLQELAILRRASAVAVRRGLQFTQTRPPPIAVDDHGDVVRKLLPGELPTQPGLVEAVQPPPTERNGTLAHTPTLAVRRVYSVRSGGVPRLRG